MNKKAVLSREAGMKTKAVLSRAATTTALRAEANQKWHRYVNDLMSAHNTDALEWRHSVSMVAVLDRVVRQLAESPFGVFAWRRLRRAD